MLLAGTVEWLNIDPRFMLQDLAGTRQLLAKQEALTRDR